MNRYRITIQEEGRDTPLLSMPFHLAEPLGNADFAAIEGRIGDEVFDALLDLDQCNACGLALDRSLKLWGGPGRRLCRECEGEGRMP